MCQKQNLMHFVTHLNNLGFALLCTATNDKLLHAFGIVQQNCNNQKTKKDFSKFSK
jgi:Leu/Phe-tRNA-protein transferase